ncbi:hypothetical protein C8N28_0837 [Albibacterium bauzanense]|uniref:Uncharacterized protein n=1 Tax=Albibacterium bauzanense TaxID=653929 RepID=A0A4R1M0T9_9SPHI|nr:hypothetical protein C8N28_0837 [Albibacterium bauzanense]
MTNLILFVVIVDIISVSTVITLTSATVVAKRVPVKYRRALDSWAEYW